MTEFSRKNDCGVYTEREVLELPLDRKGWRGCPLAEIRLAFTEAGWRATRGFSFTTGNHWGSSSPLTDHDTPFATRQEAIENAAARLRRDMDAQCIEESMQAQRRKILDWVDSLRPVQGDLFAILAA